jgi:outer membrane protein assembly factor BamE
LPHFSNPWEKPMKKALCLLTVLLCLSGCSILRVHKMDIEQGNVMTPEMTNQLHPGMSEERVKDIMGPPMLVNTFNDNRIDYVYTFKPGYGQSQQKTITLIFRNHVLKEIQGNRYSQFIQ